jgi:hypothetical protein
MTNQKPPAERKIDPRFFSENRIPISKIKSIPEIFFQIDPRFQNKNRIPFFKIKSRSGFQIAIRIKRTTVSKSLASLLRHPPPGSLKKPSFPHFRPENGVGPQCGAPDNRR